MFRFWGNFRKIEEFLVEIWEEVIQNEVSLGGSPIIKVTLITSMIFESLSPTRPSSSSSSSSSSPGVIFLHGYRAQSGSVAGKRHSFEMVSSSHQETNFYWISIVFPPRNPIFHRCACEKLNFENLFRSLQTHSSDTSISTRKQKLRRKGAHSKVSYWRVFAFIYRCICIDTFVHITTD